MRRWEWLKSLDLCKAAKEIAYIMSENEIQEEPAFAKEIIQDNYEIALRWLLEELGPIDCEIYVPKED